MFIKIKKLLFKFDWLILWISLWIFFAFSTIPQKLEFYSLQNAIVENLVERGKLAFHGVAYSSNWFIQNLNTKTSQLSYIGDVYEYNGSWYPAKSYGAHYWSALSYKILLLFGFSFNTHYQLVIKILLFFSSSLVVSLGTTLTYLVAKQISQNNIIALLVSLSLTFGSLLTGGINVRNEETFGYWLFVIAYMMTFFGLRNKWWTMLQIVIFYYSMYSLPIIILLLPLGLYRVYHASGNKHFKFFVLTNLVCIMTIIMHNYLIFGKIVFSNYSIGEEKVEGYRLGRLMFSWSNFFEKGSFYFLNSSSSIFANYPLIVIGIIGVFLSKQSRLTKLITVLSVSAFALFISNIGELTGYIGYGSGRYMQGIFPIVYIYIIYIFSNFRPFMWITSGLAAIISIHNGLFFYFSPVRHVFDKSSTHFNSLPLGENIFWVITSTTVFLFYVLIFLNQRRKNRVFRTPEV